MLRKMLRPPTLRSAAARWGVDPDGGVASETVIHLVWAVSHPCPPPRPDAQILPKYRGMTTVCVQRGFAPLHSHTRDRPLYFGRIWASGLGGGHGWLTAQTRCITCSDDTPPSGSTVLR